MLDRLVSRGWEMSSRASSTPAVVDALADDLNTPLALVATWFGASTMRGADR